MGLNFSRFMREIRGNSKGIIVGMTVGFITSYYIKIKGIDLSFTLQRQGLIDSFARSMNIGDIAFLKVAIVYVLLGAFVGYLIDKYVPIKKR